MLLSPRLTSGLTSFRLKVSRLPFSATSLPLWSTSRDLFCVVFRRTEARSCLFFSYLRSSVWFGPTMRVHRELRNSLSRRSWVSLSRMTVRCRFRNWRSMVSKRANRVFEYVSSALMLSSSIFKNSLNVRCSVCDVRCVFVVPKTVVNSLPIGVGSPVEGFCKRPIWERREWMFVKAELSEPDGYEGRAASSRLAQSMTINIPSISPSTFAKNLVNSMASVLSDSLRASSSPTMTGADVIFAKRIDSPRSHTATPDSCKSPIWRTPFSE